jgi:hypothetical protein
MAEKLVERRRWGIERKVSTSERIQGMMKAVL